MGILVVNPVGERYREVPPTTTEIGIVGLDRQHHTERVKRMDGRSIRRCARKQRQIRRSVLERARREVDGVEAVVFMAIGARLTGDRKQVGA